MLNNTEHTGYAVKLAVSRIRRRYDDHTSLGLSSFLSSCVLRADIHSCDSSDASQLSRSHLSILRPSILLYKIGFIIHLWNCRHFCCESSRYPISRLYMLSITNISSVQRPASFRRLCYHALINAVRENSDLSVLTFDRVKFHSLSNKMHKQQRRRKQRIRHDNTTFRNLASDLL
ncbi:hypothetical protein Tsp_13116 [Trichinella spiralis]|uniref:hypothetical protein n=1 Tax=Trichinella spiralis TaxID=6334 RepID=UPI0001EFD409|nr:hypothetical protein Tsp_12858 [Trichinella spiralis]XP_003368864.1 hypothetical protein Tsp_13116 [Trichinella spiralis]